MRGGAVLIRCLTIDDTGGDVITNEPEYDAGNADKDAGTLCAAGADRLRAANPNLLSEQASTISDPIEAVYNEEVAKAAERALQQLVKRSTRPDVKRVLSRSTIDRLLPLVNLGAFSNEEAYNALAPAYNLPAWDAATAASIESNAKALQSLPENSNPRNEASQRLTQQVLKATVDAGGRGAKISHYSKVAGALWTANVLSRPTTQVVNLAATTTSVFMEAAAEARGYYVASIRAEAPRSRPGNFTRTSWGRGHSRSARTPRT